MKNGFTPYIIFDLLRKIKINPALYAVGFNLQSRFRFFARGMIYFVDNVKRLRGRGGRSSCIRGFTLLEMIIAIFIIMVGFLGVMQLIQRVIATIPLAFTRLQAIYLAQEGVEIVRNIRDTNWLGQRTNPTITWDQGLGAGDWEADFDDFTLTAYLARNLRIDGGFYNYDSGTETKFKRKITIQKPEPNTLQISIEVSWQERGVPYLISLQENLYNWK